MLINTRLLADIDLSAALWVFCCTSLTEASSSFIAAATESVPFFTLTSQIELVMTFHQHFSPI